MPLLLLSLPVNIFLEGLASVQLQHMLDDNLHAPPLKKQQKRKKKGKGIRRQRWKVEEAGEVRREQRLAFAGAPG